jgi:sulfite reductase (NADPH) flavoprotein alpha-component
MNNPVPPVAPTAASQKEEPQIDFKYTLLGYISYWPAIVAGLLITMGMFALSPDPRHPWLVWLPLLLLGGLLLVAIAMYPRLKKQQEEPWEKREREAALHAKVAPAAPTVEASAAQAQEAAPAEAPVEAPKAAPAAPVVAGDVDVLIMWGSETGTAQGLAEMTETKLKDTGLSARAVSMAGVTLDALPGFKKVLVITSTWGDGEPPSNAIDLWEAFQKKKVDLSNTRFSVLALGDTAYPQFCKCGKDFDEFLASQGAQRLHPRVDCDLDYEAPFEKWLSGVQKVIGS